MNQTGEAMKTLSGHKVAAANELMEFGRIRAGFVGCVSAFCVTHPCSTEG